MNTYDNSKIIGAVKKDGAWRLFFGTIGEWIMDYKANDPQYKEDREFRNGILQVDDSNVYEFIEAMRPNELSIEDIYNIKNNKDLDAITLSILIDFDQKLFVNNYPDLLLEDYIPDGWIGFCDDALKYVPSEIRNAFLLV